MPVIIIVENVASPHSITFATKSLNHPEIGIAIIPPITPPPIIAGDIEAPDV